MSVSTARIRQKHSALDFSVVHKNHATLQVCNYVYDNCPPSFLGTSELFYESHAVYENPLITATSRAFIADIHSFMHHICVIDMPRPATVLRSIAGIRTKGKDIEPWFRALRIWSEIDDLSETDSFDGQKKSLVEHTLNILLFPDLHATFNTPSTLSLHRPPSPLDDGPSFLWAFSATPSLHIPGTSLAVPSPLYFQLPIMTRLHFNEQGLITYHRDVWDIRDVLRLVPGVRVVLWFSTRITTWGLAWVSRRWRRCLRDSPARPSPRVPKVEVLAGVGNLSGNSVLSSFI